MFENSSTHTARNIRNIASSIYQSKGTRGTIQTKCAACSQEEKVQRKGEEEELIQAKLIPQIQKQENEVAQPPADAQPETQPTATETPEAQADAPNTVAPIEITGGGPEFSCEPTPMRRADFLAEPDTDDSQLGLTRLSVNQVVFPEANTVPMGNQLTLEPTFTSVGEIRSIFTTAGSYIEGEMPATEGRCPGGMYPIRWSISGPAAQKIREGEQEHCNDFQYAFESTLKRYEAAVNEIAGVRTFASQAAANDYLEQRTGVAPVDWRSTFVRLAEQTLVRDQRNWHTPDPAYSDPYYSDCENIRAILRGDSFDHIGDTPSSDIIQ